MDKNRVEYSILPSERLILSSSEKISKDEFIEQFVKGLPYVTAILNEKREVIISNNILIDGKNEIAIEAFFGRSAGEPLNCLHTNKPYVNCEGNGVCRYCGLPNALIQAEMSGKKEMQDTNILVSMPGEEEKNFDVRITAAPLNYKNEKYLLFTIMDVSEQKRKRALERIFFHDILNKTGSLQGVFELLMDHSDQNDKDELLELSRDIIKDLNEEILLHKSVMAAENGDLKVNRSNVQTTKVLEESINQVIQYPASQKIDIELSKKTTDETFHSDPMLLKRILINMLKNGLEASKREQRVETGCYSQKRKIVFWVHNFAYIPPQEQIKIFERTYSTKGENRGLGTYSMKLLGEKYLGGKVYFETDNTQGTNFYLEIPKE
ncbi:MAG: sensor histidine kinase [Bacteroidales bacterium]